MNIGIRDSKGRFIKGHALLAGSEKGWFKKDKYSWSKHPNFKNGIWSYDKFKKSKCEDCVRKKDLQVHHIDKNRKNNKLSNLKTVCRICHWKYHLGKTPWNKGLVIGPQSYDHRTKRIEAIRRFYAI